MMNKECEWRPKSGSDLTLVVNWTPVLMMRGFCGCVGIQGCFSTTKELKTKQTSFINLLSFIKSWWWETTAAITTLCQLSRHVGFWGWVSATFWGAPVGFLNSLSQSTLWFTEIVPLDEVVNQVFNSLLQLWFLQRNRVALVGNLYDQFSEFVQLALDLEEALCRHGEPAGAEGGAALKRTNNKQTGC